MSDSPLRSLYVKHETDIRTYPSMTTNYHFDKGAQISIGDLHGNALKLIWFLLKHNVIGNISEQEYNRFVKLYEKDPKEVNKNDIQWFNLFIKKIKVNQGGTIRLLGDELADRGSNDYFTLKILEKLLDNNVPLEIVLSNHTADFIRAYETQNNYLPNNLAEHFVKSMFGLNQLIDRDLVSKKDIDTLFEKIYTTNLKALTYTINEKNQSIAVFSHAPIGLETIESLCQKLNITYCDDSLEELAQTIDDINTEFTNNYAKNKAITNFLESERQYKMGNIDVKRFPFMHLIWNRNYNSLNRPNHHKGYTIKYIHGHDSREQNVIGHIYNLDNNLGKGNNDLASYNVHYTHEKSAAQLQNSTRRPRRKKKQKNITELMSAPLLFALVLGCVAASFAWTVSVPSFMIIGVVSAISSFCLHTTAQWIYSKIYQDNESAQTKNFTAPQNKEKADKTTHHQQSANLLFARNQESYSGKNTILNNNIIQQPRRKHRTL